MLPTPQTENLQQGRIIHRLAGGLSIAAGLLLAACGSGNSNVASVVPITTTRSVVKLSPERAQKRLEHWQSIVYAACEQSGRAFVPQVAAPIGLSAWLANRPQNNATRILLNPIGALRLAELPKPADYIERYAIELLVGAEGGLSQAEIDAALSQGFKSIVLGTRILRTETAALTAIAAMQTLWGDF